jgi:hypothetical protein
MTSDITKEIIVGSIAVFFTALFAGLPGMALFWWTYQRDQERLIVEKTRPRGVTLEGKQVFATDNLGPVFGIVIRNRSLFSVHVNAVGFEIDGEVLPAEHPLFPVRMKRNPDRFSPYINITDEDTDPCEIASQASLQVSLFSPVDRKKFLAALLRAANKRHTSVESILNGPKTIAMVETETGKLFTSMPFRKRIYRQLLRIKREMDGQLTSSRESD